MHRRVRSYRSILTLLTKNVTWSWQVIEGTDVAEIEGADNEQTVNVRIKGSGPYQMRVQAGCGM